MNVHDKFQVASAIVQASDRLDWLKSIERIALFQFLCGGSQVALAKRLGISQPTVSYRVKRAVQRLRILADYPKLDVYQICEILSAVGWPDPEHNALLVLAYLETGCQAHAGIAFNRSQGWARHNLLKLQAHLMRFPSGDLDLLLKALNTALTGRIKNINSPQEKEMLEPVPSLDDLLSLAQETLKTEQPTAPRPVSQESLDNKDSEGITQAQALLRKHGPQRRDSLVALLEAKQIPGHRILKVAVRHRKVFSISMYGGIWMLLLPPVASSVKESFELDWHVAVQSFCRHYDSFSMEDLARHLGLLRSRTVFQDNLDILKNLVRANGFRQCTRRWERKRQAEIRDTAELREKLLTTIAEAGAIRLRELREKLSLPGKLFLPHLRELEREGKVTSCGNNIYFANES